MVGSNVTTSSAPKVILHPLVDVEDVDEVDAED